MGRETKSSMDRFEDECSSRRSWFSYFFGCCLSTHKNNVEVYDINDLLCRRAEF